MSIGTFIGYDLFAELDDLTDPHAVYETLRIKRRGTVLIELHRHEVRNLVDFLEGRMISKVVE